MNPLERKGTRHFLCSIGKCKTFDELWVDIKPCSKISMWWHNAAFDMRVLSATLAHYDLAVPHCSYFVV